MHALLCELEVYFVWNFTKIQGSHMCTGVIAGGRDGCKGDSGGGLIISDNLDPAIRNVEFLMRDTAACPYLWYVQY